MIIVKCSEFYLKGVVQLFKENYIEYQYSAFQNTDKLKNLILEKMKAWIAVDMNKVVGFAALYNYDHFDCNYIKLAHLLVNKDYRGQHVGKQLENKREDYYNELSNLIVIASCVELPNYSIKLKLQRGFHHIGTRMNYRKNITIGYNSIMMMKTNIVFNERYIIDKPTNETLNFLQTVCGRFDIKIEVLHEHTEHASRIQFKNNVYNDYLEFEQVLDESEDVVEMEYVLDYIRDNGLKQYTSITIFPSQCNFSKVDALFQSLNIYPTVVYVNYPLKNTKIEYQLFNYKMLQENTHIRNQLIEMEENI